MLSVAVNGTVHGENWLTLHKPLPREAEIVVDTTILDVFDKGPGKHALVYGEQRARLAETDEALYTERHTTVLLGLGGFGGKREGQPVPHAMPQRESDVICEMPTSPNQALIYALNGDRTDFHRKPEAATRQGYVRPIMHGLCSYGIACHAILKTLLGYDHTAIRAFDVRFVSVAFPGETYVVEMWREDSVISFRARIRERDAVIIDHGKCVFA